MNRRYTTEHIDFIRDNFPGTSISDFTAMFNEHFGLKLPRSTVQSLVYRNGIHNGRDFKYKKEERGSPASEFKKGQIPWNKGMKGWCAPGSEATQFKKGHIPHQHRPIGSEIIGSDGYTWVKIEEPNVRREKHRIIYEQYHGPIPEGHIVLFADRNKKNFDIDNLMLVSRRMLAILNKNGLITQDANITRIGVEVAKLRMKITDVKGNHQSRSVSNA